MPPSTSPPPHRIRPSPLALALLRRLLPRAERDEIVADVHAEFDALASAFGEPTAQRWLRRQALGSVPSLLRWGWWRGWSGFEPPANAYRPGGPMLKSLFADIRYAARRLRARPSYTLLSVLTLALGIGGTAAVFGIARPLVFDPLPFANEKEVAFFWMSGSWNEQEFTFLRGKFPGYRAVATYREGDMTMRNGDGPAQLLPGLSASSELFDVLGASPLMGRTFEKGEDVPGAEPVAVLSHGLWQELGGKADIIGSRLVLDGTPRTVVGVMPRGFWFPNPSVRLWTPRPINPEGQNGSYTFVGHVLPGQDPSNMAGHTASLVRILDERFDYPSDWDKTKDAWVKPIRDELLGSMRPALLATFVAMGLILLIACTNVAALMLGQVEGRASELAVRAALGASRRRLTQPLVVEAVLIGLLAATVGAGLAAAGFGLLARALPIGAWAESARFDWTLFVGALVIAMVAVLLVVLIPGASLLRSDSQRDLHGTLSRARTGGVGRGGVRMEKGLVIAEVALAMLIASGAALLVRSVSNLYAIDPGIDTKGIAVVDAVASSDVATPERRVQIGEMLDAVRALPGVTSAAAAMKVPLRGGGDSFGITIPGREEAERTNTFFRVVTPGYFETMGIKVEAGRGFDGTDQESETEINVVVNRALADVYFPGENPIGRTVGGGFNVPQRIVGVVENVAEAALTDDRTPVRYFVSSQVPWFGTRAALMIRTARDGDAERILDAARSTVNKSVPTFAVQGTTTMERVFDKAVGPARQIMSLLTLLSALALTLGAVGIYGVISHFAARRKRDWAIRVALGLPGRRVVTNMLGQGATLVVAGIVFGVAGTLVLARLLASFLFGVSTVDPLSFIAASGAMLLTGLAAAFIPARRAGTVDPALVLREE